MATLTMDTPLETLEIKPIEVQLIELLTDAAELLSNPAKWTQGNMAETADGENITYFYAENRNKAVKFCAIGALEYLSPVSGLTAVDWVTRVLMNKGIMQPAELVGLAPLAAYNDRPETTAQDIVALFKETIEFVKQEYNSTPV
jgi:hypothetical protein